MKGFLIKPTGQLRFVIVIDLLLIDQREKEKIMGNKRQVQHLVANSKNIVRLKPRNPEEKSSSPVIVRALCDFVQGQVGFSKVTLTERLLSW